MAEENFFKRKEVTTLFSIFALVSGFVFLNKAGVTGNVILEGQVNNNLISLIGLTLVLCSAVLAIYSARK